MKKPKKNVPTISEKKSLGIRTADMLAIPEETLLEATGFQTEDASDLMFYAVLRTLFTDGNEPKQTKREVKRIISAMSELKPRDGFEGLLISQMLSIYNKAMSCLALAENNRESPEFFLKLQNQSMKLMRLYCQQLDALSRYRNKGRQQITVQRVDVNSGGRAVIGHIDQTGGGVKNEK